VLLPVGGADHACLVGEHDRLDAVAEVELVEDVGHMGLDRQGCEDEPVGDPSPRCLKTSKGSKDL